MPRPSRCTPGPPASWWETYRRHAQRDVRTWTTLLYLPHHGLPARRHLLHPRHHRTCGWPAPGARAFRGAEAGIFGWLPPGGLAGHDPDRRLARRLTPQRWLGSLFYMVFGGRDRDGASMPRRRRAGLLAAHARLAKALLVVPGRVRGAAPERAGAVHFCALRPPASHAAVRLQPGQRRPPGAPRNSRREAPRPGRGLPAGPGKTVICAPPASAGAMNLDIELAQRRRIECERRSASGTAGGLARELRRAAARGWAAACAWCLAWHRCTKGRTGRGPCRPTSPWIFDGRGTAVCHARRGSLPRWDELKQGNGSAHFGGPQRSLAHRRPAASAPLRPARSTAMRGFLVTPLRFSRAAPCSRTRPRATGPPPAQNVANVEKTCHRGNPSERRMVGMGGTPGSCSPRGWAFAGAGRSRAGNWRRTSLAPLEPGDIFRAPRSKSPALGGAPCPPASYAFEVWVADTHPERAEQGSDVSSATCPDTMGMVVPACRLHAFENHVDEEHLHRSWTCCSFRRRLARVAKIIERAHPLSEAFAQLRYARFRRGWLEIKGRLRPRSWDWRRKGDTVTWKEGRRSKKSARRARPCPPAQAPGGPAPVKRAGHGLPRGAIWAANCPRDAGRRGCFETIGRGIGAP